MNNGAWRIEHGDALELLRQLPARSIDAVITDPPFFTPAVHYQSRVKWQRQWADMTILTHWWGLICDAIKPALKSMSHCLVFCNADSYAAFYPAMFSRWDKLNCLVWDKERPGLGRVWRHSHELIIAARDSESWTPDDGQLRRDVLTYKATLSADREHPVEKPAALLADLIRACCPPGGTVLDPFMGSGTTGEGALWASRQFVGFELSETYIQSARERLGRVDASPLLPLQQSKQMALAEVADG